MIGYSFSKFLTRQDHAVAPLESLSFSHSRFTKTYRLTNQQQHTDLVLENGRRYTHEPAGFNVGIPTQDGQLTSDLAVALSEVTGEMVDQLNRAIRKPDEQIMCNYRIMQSANDRPGFSIKLRISDISAIAGEIHAVATRSDFLNMRFPRASFDLERFPGLDR